MRPRSARQVLKILKVLQAYPEGLRARELAQILGASLPMVGKALDLLQEEGFVVQDPLSKRHLIRYPHPFLELPEAPDDPLFYQDLVEAAYARTGFRSYAISLRPWGFHPEATFGNRGQRVWPFPGERKTVTPHAHASAGGRAILAHLRQELVRAHFYRFPPRPLTPRTPTTLERVIARLAEARRLGFATARGELIPDRCGLAVPLLARSGEAFAAVGLSLPLGKACALEDPENPKACRMCLALFPALKEEVAKLWPFSGR